MIRRLIIGGLLIVAAGGIDPAPARAADPAVIVEPTELARRPDLVGREVLVDDRIRYFLESKRGQGYDELILRRTEVPFRLGLGSRFARPPSEPNAVVRAVLKVVDGRLIGDVITVDLLPADAERLDREVGRTRPDDFAARRTWALWAERRGRELNDPKLEARGVALEGEAFTTEANRPSADVVALADAAAGRPIPPTVRNAIYHRGFRALEAQARTPADLDDLARRVRAALPRAADPVAGATATPTPTDADPAAAYRAATAEEQARLDRRLYADILARSLELRLLADPAQAATLADEATRTLPDRPGVADKLRRRGLAEAERGVATMRQSEVEELARTFRADGQDDRARRVLEEWLADRRKNRLSPSDAEGRVLLAANYEKLLGDRATAGALLAEAAAIEPESRAIADAFLRLGYRKGDNGWFDPTAAATADSSATPPSPTATAAGAGAGGEGDSLRGLTRAQARARMGGKPDRVVRSATQGMIVEQWVYRTGKTDQFVLFRIDAATTDPRVFASYSITRK